MQFTAKSELIYFFITGISANPQHALLALAVGIRQQSDQVFAASDWQSDAIDETGFVIYLKQHSAGYF